ncbi:DUF411 domain-containing protein [Marinimicrobium sp. ABcell2]|uniref:DUF411 domain-containing protein n=1 Tax=Marinimicrobium sp. ABcell2 TaxID=3069751 RepID=UPI0027B4FC71|nr:DUF411 domain-containing protein [Marinimicrobium sp. ABcell2]MDQ2076335.1 DUF411 domain-containing protein [Marinimicrobium sp. ABcell2]
MNKYLALWLLAAVALVGCGQAGDNANDLTASQSEPLETVALTVYKSPTCLCCDDWVVHMEERGFSAQGEHPDNLYELKRELGIQDQYASCHTAVTESGYVFEGHIPAHLVRRFLDAPPEGALGLAVPRMPMGSPGMEMGNRFEPYDVLLLKHDGEHEVFARVDSPQEQYH